MESAEQLKQRVLKEKQVIARLCLAKTRLEAAEREHIWAIAAAHAEGLSIRKIAGAMGLSSSRVHQLLHTDEAQQIPEWLNSLRELRLDRDEPPKSEEITPSLRLFQSRLADEVEVLRRCTRWFEQLAMGETVVVNLRAESDAKTAYVRVDQNWVLRVLKRITADLDSLSGRVQLDEKNQENEDPIAADVEHRRRLAEPEPQWSSLSQRDQRAILREKMGLPPL